MTKTNRAIGVSAVAFFASALIGVACDPGSTSSDGSAGAPGIAGSGSAGARNFAGGAGSAGGPGSSAGFGSITAGAGGGGGAAGASCTPLPTNRLLTDFSPATLIPGVTEGSTWTAGKAELWGSAPSTLTGGDVFYQGKSTSAAKATLSGQTLTVDATIEAGDYAGYMFNFKPACTNASTTQGLQFDVLAGSTLGNATLKVQMQQKSDYPSTANPGTRPGDCMPLSAASQYNDCLSPAMTVAGSGSVLGTGTTLLPWTSFGGGKPVLTVDSSQLMAIQWQFECPPDGGTVSAAGGSGGNSGGGGMSGGAGAGAGAGAGGSSAGSGGAGLAGAGTNSGGADSSLGGTSGSAGSAGAVAAGGSSGQSGVGGGSGSSGANGTAGSNGGSGGSGGSAGSSAAAGSGGTAGAQSSTTPPCVVHFTFDNVTFY